MTTRVQPPKEDVTVYFTSFNEVKEQVVIGLYSKDLASMIMARFHQDKDHLFEDIISYERVAMDRLKKSETPITYQRSQTTLTHPIQLISPNFQNRDRVQPRKCFSCNQPGHLANQ